MCRDADGEGIHSGEIMDRRYKNTGVLRAGRPGGRFFCEKGPETESKVKGTEEDDFDL